ncbi:DNA polymerase III subunit alpha [Vallicoccus soli]|uniref:DNA polymerase III subunit alpha n=1 Tax=Vallicoccus soli TaxID=2339232 RepID=A0A3A3ZL60_9ACTN|nr:DNA polymerase III subunit alpha [Vallicoccus soli]RJK96832.1 DNA polymerase III subunit alpha [Vallicoccus soli]
MSDPFVHLHVASGYSLRYGASLPHVLVGRAADLGQDALALTDRDGTYGAVKFVKACQAAGVRPILGVDLAVEPTGLLQGVHPALRGAAGAAAARRTPARGGASVDPRHPRVTLLATSGPGWAALCRLVSATHLRGERGRPVSTLDLVAEHVDLAGEGGLVVLLGPQSEPARALAARRPDLARAVLRRWREATGPGDLQLEVVSHRGDGDTVRAARVLGLAREEGLGAVLSNAVRYADRSDAPTADVLDAARRLVALDVRHVDRRTAEGYLKGGKEMALVADEVARAAGLDGSGPSGGAAQLLAGTRRLAERCAVDPRRDLGIGEVRFPELDVVSGAVLEDGRRVPADVLLRRRCEEAVPTRYPGASDGQRRAVQGRLDDELEVVRRLGYPSYFLTVADVVDLIKGMGVRCAARGSGAGSLVNYLLGVSGVDPLAHGLLMERFLSPLRAQLPDIDVDVESARRTEIYERILERYGGDRCTCVSMMDTYRVRHAIRDVGAALGLPPGEVDALAKAFPHIRARDARLALAELPELRASGIGAARLDLLFRLVERLDGLPRHVALHPCGVLLSDTTLLDRTPVEASWMGFPMSQFDKDDVEDLGLLKLDVLGVRMQSAMAHAAAEVARVDGVEVDLDAVPLDDPATYRLIQSTRTLGCFQIESPGQRELVGKFAPETFGDLITDISLFRPGPVKSDMVTPFLMARQGWRDAEYLHEDLRPALEETCGVVVFHEQVLRIVEALTGCTLAEADEARRALGSPETQPEVEAWFRPLARDRGYDRAVVDRVWEVLKAFASFGFCKAHAAAFALPTYQSAWLKAHHTAAFLAGVLTHDPGMYPKRLILDDARQFGIAVLGLDVNRSGAGYHVERVAPYDEPPPVVLGRAPRQAPEPGLPDARAHGIRLGLSDVKGISEAEVARILAGRPYGSLADFWHRTGTSRPVVERLVVAGAFDGLYGIGTSLGAGLALPAGTGGGDGQGGGSGNGDDDVLLAMPPAPARRRRGQVTRRDLLLQVAELDRWSRATARAARGASRRRGRGAPGGGAAAGSGAASAGGAPGAGAPGAPGAAGAGPDPAADAAAARAGALARAAVDAELVTTRERGRPGADAHRLAARQSRAPRAVEPEPVQLALELGDAPDEAQPSGLPEMSGADRVRAELEVLGLDVSRHVVDFYRPFLDELGTTRAPEMRHRRSGSDLLVAGVKVATQTPPIRSGRRVVFVTLDDATGPVDATFFEDAQGPYAATVFHSWLLVVRGVLRRTGPRGVSMRATGCWELPALFAAWQEGGMEAVMGLTHGLRAPVSGVTEQAVAGAAESRASRPVMARPPVGGSAEVYEPREFGGDDPAGAPQRRAGGMGPALGGRRVLVHASGFRQSPYADVKPAGGDSKSAPRKLWHSSPGSSGA